MIGFVRFFPPLLPHPRRHHQSLEDTHTNNVFSFQLRQSLVTKTRLRETRLVFYFLLELTAGSLSGLNFSRQRSFFKLSDS